VGVVDSAGFRPPKPVFERERTDIDFPDFDFFEDSPTSETAREQAPPKRRRRLPTRPPAGGTPLLRLAALIAGAILLAVVLVLWVNSCREDRKTAQYEDYMETAGGVAGDSQQIGRDLEQLVFTAGIQLPDLQAQLEGLRQAQSQTVRRAQDLDAPGPLREQHESLVEALQLRVSGLNGLAGAFAQVTDTTQAEAAGTLLSQQSDRLVASDVIYEDFFKARSQDVMDEEGVTGVAVPDSDFVAGTELTSPRSWNLVVQRLTTPAAAGGLHGNNIAGVRALPGGKELSPTEENTVQASDRLAYEVLVENSGDNLETQVKVSLTIQQSPEPIRKEAQIDAINPGDTKTVRFDNLGAVSLGSRTTLRVTVDPVAGEENTRNNTAEYVVFYTFG
jgi:CARDB protein